MIPRLLNTLQHQDQRLDHPGESGGACRLSQQNTQLADASLHPLGHRHIPQLWSWDKAPRDT